MTRRGLLGLAGSALVAAPLSACGGGAPKDSGGGGKKTFTVYWNAGHNYQAYQKVVDEFEKKHGVTVTMQRYQWDAMRERLTADLSSGNVPDLVEEPGGWPQEYASSGDALSLQDYIDADGKEMGFPADWQEDTVRRNSYQGKVYGIQMHLTCQLVFYNKEMLDAAQVEPPTTWESVIQVGRKLTSGKVHGFALNQDPAYGWPWLLQNGVVEYDAKRKTMLTPRDAAIEALQFQQDLVFKYKISPRPTVSKDYSGPQKLLSAGRAAMIHTGPWDLDPIAKSSPDLKLGIAQALTHKKQSTIAGGTSLFIPKKAKQPDLAWDFIKRVTKLEVELAVSKEAKMTMPRKSWATDSEVKADPVMSEFAKGLVYAVDTGQLTRTTGKSEELGEQMKKLYQSVVMQQRPVAEAYDAYAEATSKILRS